MNGSDRMNPARVILPASTMALAGMAWRIGWIDGNMVGAVLFGLLAIVTLFGATVVLSFPILLATVLTWLLFSGLVRFRRERQARTALPARHAEATP